MDCEVLCTTAAVVEEYCLFECKAVWTGRNLPAIRRKVLFPSSLSKSKPREEAEASCMLGLLTLKAETLSFLKISVHFYQSTRLHILVYITVFCSHDLFILKLFIYTKTVTCPSMFGIDVQSAPISSSLLQLIPLFLITLPIHFSFRPTANIILGITLPKNEDCFIINYKYTGLQYFCAVFKRTVPSAYNIRGITCSSCEVPHASYDR
jgi:hypothetical protein